MEPIPPQTGPVTLLSPPSRAFTVCPSLTDPCRSRSVMPDKGLSPKSHRSELLTPNAPCFEGLPYQIRPLRPLSLSSVLRCERQRPEFKTHLVLGENLKRNMLKTDLVSQKTHSTRSLSRPADDPCSSSLSHTTLIRSTKKRCCCLPTRSRVRPRSLRRHCSHSGMTRHPVSLPRPPF